jgi:hypothetical protein
MWVMSPEAQQVYEHKVPKMNVKETDLLLQKLPTLPIFCKLGNYLSGAIVGRHSRQISKPAHFTGLEQLLIPNIRLKDITLIMPPRAESHTGPIIIPKHLFSPDKCDIKVYLIQN